MKRITVSHACARRCRSCLCPTDAVRPPGLEQVLESALGPEIVLGGGDATLWPALEEFLERNAAADTPKRVWLEAPAARLGQPVLEQLAAAGAYGVSVQIEALGAKMVRYLNVGDGVKAVADAERAGLQVMARACVRPSTFRIVPTLARRLFPRRVLLEYIRQDWGRPPTTIDAAALEQALISSSNLELSANRSREGGYLPPCAMPRAWQVREAAWRNTFRQGEQTPNDALDACAECGINRRCQWNDPSALDAETRAAIVPLRTPGQRQRSTESAVPTHIVHKRRGPPVICTTPWTTIEIVDPNGEVRQCCSQWTHGDLGNVFNGSIAEIWNGPGFQRARRIMSGEVLDELCRPICPRLSDHNFSETEFRIQDGSEAFVKNQLLMAEEIAQRKEVVASRPLWLLLCPSSYCNYNCIMCTYGRTTRRDLPEHIWDELPGYLPTLKQLTLLGGEPLANPRTWQFLRHFDFQRYPDASVDLVTNGSLLTESNLRKITNAALGDITISLNAGTAEVYDKVQRGTIDFNQLLRNIDDLIRFRDARSAWFGITLGFVAQPASTHTLLEFGEIAHRRNLRIRLLPLNIAHVPELDFYADPDAVAKVVEDLERFIAYCRRVRPEWVREVTATRDAVVLEGNRRKNPELIQLRRGGSDRPVGT